MPIYRLDRAAAVDVTGGAAVQVTWVQSGGTEPVHVEALVAQVPWSRTIRPRPGLVVVPPSSDAVILRALPSVGEVFGTPTQLELQLMIGAAADPEIVRIPAQDLSGLPMRDVVRIEQVEGATRITAIDSGQVITLGPLADRARALTRTLCGVDRLDDVNARSITAVVDTSGSMAPLLTDGTVAAALDLLIGVAQVVSPDGVVRVTGVGSELQWTGEHSPATQAERAVAELTGTASSTGFRTAVLPPTTADGLTYLITDGVPADGPTGAGVQLVALTSPQAWSILTAGSGAKACVVEPGGSGRSTTEALLGDPRRLESTVRELYAAVAHRGAS